MARKLYLVGIDAAPLWLIKEFGQEKEMEVFKKLVSNKNLVEMESTLPPMTGAAWPTIYTGLSPGEHGVPDFFVMKKDYTPDLVFYNSEKTPPFWKNLASWGKKCLIITPATDIRLPDYENVDMITGFPLKGKTNSKFLGSLMKKYKFDGEPDVEKDMKAGTMTEKEGMRHFVKSVDSRVRIAKDAMAKNDYDFVYVCFTETDRLQHFVLSKKDMKEYLRPIYLEIAKFVQYLVDKVDEEGSSVMMVSDHGAQPIKEMFLINAWMVSKGYAKLKDSVMAGLEGDESKGQLTYTIRERLLKTKLRAAYDKMPHSAKGVVSKSLGKFLSAGGKGKYTRLHLFDFDMEKTMAFAGISNLDVATIWINDDRFASPVVARGEREGIKKNIARELMKIKGKDGKNLMVKVYDGDEYYGKTKKFIQPDLLVEIVPGYTIDIFNFSKSELFMETQPPKRGDHTRFGIFGTYPKKPKTKAGIFSILDVHKAVLDYYK